jgi:hypothetical protein
LIRIFGIAFIRTDSDAKLSSDGLWLNASKPESTLD